MEKMKLGADDTFRFSCKQCGKCCINRDDIILTPFDLFRASKKLNPPIIRRIVSANVKSMYIEYKILAVSPIFGVAFVRDGPVISIFAIVCPSKPSAGRRATTRRIIPSPPSH